MQIDVREETCDPMHATVWRDDVFAFASEPFRTTPMESFTTEAAARVWLEV